MERAQHQDGEQTVAQFPPLLVASRSHGLAARLVSFSRRLPVSRKLKESFDIYQTIFHSRGRLTSVEFDEIFGQLVADSEAHFRLFANAGDTDRGGGGGHRLSPKLHLFQKAAHQVCRRLRAREEWGGEGGHAPPARIASRLILAAGLRGARVRRWEKR